MKHLSLPPPPTPTGDAPQAGVGRCAQCHQTRPLFLHQQRQKITEVHGDCSDCGGHKAQRVATRNLCPRCWSDTPATAEYEEEIG